MHTLLFMHVKIDIKYQVETRFLIDIINTNFRPFTNCIADA